MVWIPIDWDQIKTSYAPGTHNDSADPTTGNEEDQLKAAQWNLYEDTLVEHHARIEAMGLEGTIASATTPDIGAEEDDVLVVTGTTDITGFVTATAGVTRRLIFSAVLTLTDGATLSMLPSGNRDIITAAGDWGVFVSRGSGNWECIYYQRADGLPNMGVVQDIPNFYTAAGSTSSTIPYDDSKPQNTEGGEFITQAITPKYPDSLINVSAQIIGRFSVADRIIIASIFKDSDVDALKTSHGMDDNDTGVVPVFIFHQEVAGSLAARTYKVRAGPNSAATLYVNGDTTGNRRFGGASNSFLRVEEVRA